MDIALKTKVRLDRTAETEEERYAVRQVKVALKKNRERFEQSFFYKVDNKNANGLKDNVRNLKDGGSASFHDHWDVDINKKDFFGYYVFVDPDFYRALGSVKMRSTGDFSIKKNGDIFYITGKVTHAMNDVYDFNDGFPDNYAFTKERLIAKSGLAKPFKVHWKKTQNIKGIITQGNVHLYWNDDEK